MRTWKKELLSVKKIGKSNLCQLKFDNPGELALASMETTNVFLSKYLPINNLTQQLKENLTKELYILLLFGSYAKKGTSPFKLSSMESKGKATKNSDIDLFFIIKDKKNLEGFRKKIKLIINKLNYKVEFEVSTMDWFYEMLGDKTTVGREIFKTNLVLHNPEAYFWLVKRYTEKH